MGGRHIFANTPDVDVVRIVALARSRIFLFGQAVHEDDAGHGGKELARLLDGNFAFRLDDDAFRMAVRDRNADRGRADLNRGIAENLARFMEQFELFGGIAALLLASDLRNAVEADRVRERLELAVAVFAVIVEPRFGAADKIAVARHARPARRLIRTHDDPADARVIVKRLERDDHLRRGAVRA